MLHHRRTLVAPGCNGVDHFRLAVLLDSIDEIGIEAVPWLNPLGTQVISHTDHGVKLVLGDRDVIFHEQVVDDLLFFPQEDFHQLPAGFPVDAFGVIRRVAEGTIADIPLAVILVGHTAEVLKFLDHGNTLFAGGVGLHSQGGGRQQGEHKDQAEGQCDMLCGFFQYHHGHSHFLRVHNNRQNFTILQGKREVESPWFNILVTFLSEVRAKKQPSVFPQTAISQALVQDIQGQCQHDKHCADPFGCLRQLCVKGLCLALSHKGIGHAADGAGQTRALAGLDQHRQNHSQAA